MTTDFYDSPAKLSENITHFARALRKAGIPVGPARLIDAIQAVEQAGFSSKLDFYHTLRACFVSRRDHITVFDQCFRMFWRDPQFLERMMAALMPEMKAPPNREKQAAEHRASEALLDGAEKPPMPPSTEQEDDVIEFDTSLSFSGTEKLASRDFEQMTTAEIRAAEAMIAKLRLPVQPLPTRRMIKAQRGTKPDWRGAMRVAMRPGSTPNLPVKQRAEAWPSLVALCDISGSMSNYSRMLLHFLHAAMRHEGDGWSKVHAFSMGTQLTNISRALRLRDPDEALEAAGGEAQDWEGGTRLGPSLAEFNRNWARRVLGRGATVLLITDGLDRADPDLLQAETRRLRLSSRKLIWLNPLLRWEDFSPKARGVRALLGEVDSFRAAHNIASLQDLAEALTRPDDVGSRAQYRRQLTEINTENTIAPHDAYSNRWWEDRSRWGMT